MATQQSEWLGRRKKALRRIFNILDVEQRELLTRGLNFDSLFKAVKASNEALIAQIEKEIQKEEKGE